jgi:hypothetical protein
VAAEELDRLAREADLRTESGQPLRFVSPAQARPGSPANYEIRVFETGMVETRPGSLHDLFNALAWLAFPRTKAALNARHAAEIPREGPRRGRVRDLLTIFDEGGAILLCDDAELIGMLRGHRWKALFHDRRVRVREAMRIVVVGHAVLEKALDPWPGITCKVVLLPPQADVDRAAAAWIAGLPADATPELLPPVPIFGYPGWLPGSESPDFYSDLRYFRPLPRPHQGNAG